jgi:hypothetical protein
MTRIGRLSTTAANLALALLIIIASLVAFVPFAPFFPVDALDSSWQLALNAALAKGFVFGRDIIFTFGPYGSTYTEQYHPATDTQMLWSSGLLAVAFAMGLICLTQGVQRLIALGFAIFLVLVPRDIQLFTIPFVALLLVCRITTRADHPERITLSLAARLTLALLVLALATLTLVKGSFAVASLAVMVLGCVALAIRGHKSLAFGGAVLFCLTMAALWMIAKQPLGFLPGYFVAQEPIVSGYTAAMNMTGPAWQLALYVGCCVLIGLLNAPALRSSGIAGFMFSAGSAALLFLAFKEGFVRDDLGHACVAGGMLGVAGWITLLFRRRLTTLIGLAIGLAGWFCIDYPQLGISTAMLRQGEIRPTISMGMNDIETPFINAGSGLVTRLVAPDQLKQRYMESLAAIQTEEPLPKLAGTTDIYSSGQSALLANGLDWAPRPVLQSYSAYTPELAYKDAAHLTGMSAPANILFATQPIDEHLPALEDGASWPILLTRYTITGFSGDLAILQRRETASPMDPIADAPSISGVFQLGKPIALPDNTPVVWAKIDVRPTLCGKLLTLFFKPSQLNIAYLFPDGSKQTFRYIAGMGVSGFVAAPVVENATDFAALALPASAHYFAGRQPTSLVISANHGAGWIWRSAFTAQFFTVQFPVQPELSSLFPPLGTRNAGAAQH